MSMAEGLKLNGVVQFCIQDRQEKFWAPGQKYVRVAIAVKNPYLYISKFLYFFSLTLCIKSL